MRPLVALSAALLASAVAGTARVAGASPKRERVVVLDDGEKVSRSEQRHLADGPWPAGPIDLFALRGETLALQVVVEAGDAPVADARALVAPFVTTEGARLRVETETFVERFVVVERPTRSDRGGESLAFTPKSAPGDAFLGAIADALVPERFETARAAPDERAALWIDLTVPSDARAGDYRATLLVRDADRELAARPIELRVLDATLPFAAAPAFVYYAPEELTRRMGDASAETSLRELLHAHHVAAVHRISDEKQAGSHALDFDRAAVAGTAYTHALGYDGPGVGVAEGVLALGAYGTLGPPTPAARGVAEKLTRSIFGLGGVGTTAAFLYAIDESCGSDWPARWVELVRASTALRGLRVGATCDDDPSSQAADLVMQESASFDPARAHLGERAGKWVWAYNGMRPGSGPMMLDVPATDLRANAWIAMRYGVPRWFYWESTFWFDDNHGGLGGERGFDPFTVAETFHNDKGDHANGDGILVYPGTQRAAGMVDYGVDRVFPSVRLQNLRRGIEDAGYVALARAVDRRRADAVVERVVPRAMAWAGERPSWPQQARPWLEARRELAEIIASPAPPDAAGVDVSESCSFASSSIHASSASPSAALFLLGTVLLGLRASPRARRARLDKARTIRKREDEIPSTKPGHRQGAAVRESASAQRAVASTAKEPETTAVDRRKRSEVPTLPPPPTPRHSGMRAKRQTIPAPSATVDEVVADLSHDPRCDNDD
jgi:hypothetical protein